MPKRKSEETVQLINGGEKYDIKVIRSARRSISLEVRSGGEIILRSPLYIPNERIKDFIDCKADWIKKSYKKQYINKAEIDSERLSFDDINTLTKRAIPLFNSRVEYFAPLIGVKPGKISVRHQKRRWGSCSANKNMSFNCLLLLCPPYVLDGVVVHELCHIKQMNHSARFYAEIAKVLPDYKTGEKWLKTNGTRILSKLPDDKT